MASVGGKADLFTETSRVYFETKNQENFYNQVFGGEYIHVGQYDQLSGEDAKLEGLPRLIKAMRLSTDELLKRCFPPGSPPPETCTVVDLGSGMGSTARELAKRYGCKVICINIAENQNAVNAALVKAEGLEDKITIPGPRSYFDTGLPDQSADLVITQDAVVNAGSEQPRVFREASRLLKPGCLFVMADVMQSEEAKAEDMQEAYDRIGVDSFGSPSDYKRYGEDNGLELLEYKDYSANLAPHYKLVHDITIEREGSITGVDDDFFKKCEKGVAAWARLSALDLMRFGYLVFKKSAA